MSASSATTASSISSATLAPFQQFQMVFGRRCRDPRAPRPAGIEPRRLAVYEELLFNNITGFLDACYPVCRQLIGESRWRRLNRAFFRDWRSQSPYFRDIAREFLLYLAQAQHPLPAWFRDLTHYEWVELAVETSDAPCPPYARQGDLLHGQPLLNPTMFNLVYDWPVQRISAAYRPRKPQTTHLLVFRDAADVVRFAEINALTARLLQLLGEPSCTGALACERLDRENAAPSTPRAPSLHPHATAILDNLRQQGAILGVRT